MNVLIGLLFSVLLAFVIASVLADYDKARSDTQQEANALGAVYGFARGIPEPAQSIWKRDSRHYATLVIGQDWPLMQHQQSSETAWTALTTLRNDVFAFTAADAREQRDLCTKQDEEARVRRPQVLTVRVAEHGRPSFARCGCAEFDRRAVGG